MDMRAEIMPRPTKVSERPYSALSQPSTSRKNRPPSSPWYTIRLPYMKKKMMAKGQNRIPEPKTW